MTAIWGKSGTTWSVMVPVGFPKEAELHTRVEEAPQLLPLAGSPALTVLGREVRLGTGYADLIAVESSGRVVVIEVKLAYSPEARRAVVAQVLAYAAYLRGLSVEAFEGEVLKAHLANRGFATIADAVRSADQEGSFDASTFATGLATSLGEGSFRLVLVLDEAPDELTRIVGYLESVANTLVIDLVTVTAYDINGTTVLVPQRVEPDRIVAAAMVSGQPGVLTHSKPAYYAPDGGSEFRKVVAELPVDKRAPLEELTAWAVAMEHDGVAKLYTYHGPANVTLLPRIIGEETGIVTIWDKGGATVYRSVMERRSPVALAELEAHLGKAVGKGTILPTDDATLAIIRAAYAEAAR